ncbi:hypothetical protein ACFH04_36020 [Streptomyces noboritoensis]|uniref:Uncharacterized protein n=1 Tax=Streptomyces noboritoensis TaxID=67337 RepID=A0ABV6TTH3_9ACTN
MPDTAVDLPWARRRESYAGAPADIRVMPTVLDAQALLAQAYGERRTPRTAGFRTHPH